MIISDLIVVFMRVALLPENLLHIKNYLQLPRKHYKMYKKIRWRFFSVIISASTLYSLVIERKTNVNNYTYMCLSIKTPAQKRSRSHKHFVVCISQNAVEQAGCVIQNALPFEVNTHPLHRRREQLNRRSCPLTNLWWRKLIRVEKVKRCTSIYIWAKHYF